MKIFILIGVLAASLPGQKPAASAAQAMNGVAGGSRFWPLSIKLSLSSSFGEYRDGHIHAGLDIRTYGKEGIPCRAVGDGAVVRLRASPWGYGKALYLKLKTGETIVYAHLSELSPRFEEFLYQKQLEAGRYQVDVYVPGGAFRVEKGEILAFSGSTGASAPHLHFEVRDVRENPVNPLSRGWKIVDEVPPSIEGIACFPIDKTSRINGSCLPVKIRLNKTGDHTYIALDTLVLSGRAGIGVKIADRTDGASGKLAPYLVELSVDGHVLSRIKRERFSYSQTREVELEYEMESVRREGEHYLLLFKRMGETLGGRVFVDDGFLDTRSPLFAVEKIAGERRFHTAVIRAMDRNDNVSVASIPFQIASEGLLLSASKVKGAIQGGIPGLFFFSDFVSIDMDNITPQSAAMLSALGVNNPDDPEYPPASSREVISVADIGNNPFSLDLVGEEGESRIHLVPVLEGEENIFFALELGAGIKTAPNSFFSDLFLILSAAQEESARQSGPELERVATDVFLGPLSAAIKGRLGINFVLGHPSDGREAVYSWNRKKSEWSFCRSVVSRDTVSSMVHQPGTYGVFLDGIAPQIGKLEVRRHRMYGSGEVYPEIILPVTDLGSGIDDENTEIYLDGEKLVSRWDHFSKKMFILVRKKNIIGRHGLSVNARDRAGNESRLHTTIELSSYGDTDSPKGVVEDAD